MPPTGHSYANHWEESGNKLVRYQFALVRMDFRSHSPSKIYFPISHKRELKSQMTTGVLEPDLCSVCSLLRSSESWLTRHFIMLGFQ